MSAPVSAFAGSAIYLDTMLPYALLRGIDPNVKPFFARIERGDFLAYTSVLTFDELAYRLILATIKDRYGDAPLERLRHDEAKMMAECAPLVTPRLGQLRDFPHLTLVDVSALDLEIMLEAMARYQVRPRDALHFAAMRRVDCLDLASNDSHFDRIPDVRRFTL